VNARRDPVAAAPRDDLRPEGTEAPPTTGGTLRRTWSEFREDGLTDWAAALTYYGLLSLFPALLAIASVVGLVADPRELTDAALEIAPASTAESLQGPIDSMTSNSGAAGLALVLGLAGALWGASGYVGGFARASNVIYEVREGRPFWKLRPLQLLITLVMVLMIAAVTLAIVLTGPVVEALAEPLGIADPVVTAWDVAKWPVLVLVVVAMFTLLYHASPNVRPRGVRSVVPGVVLSLVVWLVASAGFALYVAFFANYDRTYGTLGGVVVLLVWLWITNIALLLGAELNAERERAAELREGVPGADRQIRLPRRDGAEPPQTE
jgi:membrane protein